MLYTSGADLGVGISYVSTIAQQIDNNIHVFDFIEAFSERFFINEPTSSLRRLISQLPLVLHGLDLSLGSPENLDESYCAKLETVIRETNCHWYSDHLSLTRINTIEVGHLMPIGFNEENIELIVSKIKYLTQRIACPFLLENIAYYYLIPNSTMDEVEFISKILSAVDCGMVLDLNNLYLNSLNHGYDAYEFLARLPLERVVEIHLAGGSFKENMHVDTHDSAITKEVWALFDYAARTIPFRGVVIERDANFEPFAKIIEEVQCARGIMQKYRVKKPQSIL